jgi:integrase
MDARGVAVSELTPELAGELVRDEATRVNRRPYPVIIAKRFTAHLAARGLAKPPIPLTARELARAKLRHEYEDYLRRQRGSSERTIANCWRFADRFLSFRVGETDISFRAITPGDVVAFLQQLSSRKAPYRDKTPPTHEALLRGLMPYRGRRSRPYIYSEREVANIAAAAAELPSACGLRGLTYKTLFGLTAVTGRRISDALALALNAGDVNLDTRVLTIRRGKLGKARLVPLDASVTERLLAYIRERDRPLGVTP